MCTCDCHGLRVQLVAEVSSLSTAWVIGIKLGSLDLTADIFTCKPSHQALIIPLKLASSLQETGTKQQRKHHHMKMISEYKIVYKFSATDQEV